MFEQQRAVFENVFPLLLFAVFASPDFRFYHFLLLWYIDGWTFGVLWRVIVKAEVFPKSC